MATSRDCSVVAALSSEMSLSLFLTHTTRLCVAAWQCRFSFFPSFGFSVLHGFDAFSCRATEYQALEGRNVALVYGVS